MVGFDHVEPDTRLVVGVHPGLGHFEPDLLVVALLVDRLAGWRRSPWPWDGRCRPSPPRTTTLVLTRATPAWDRRLTVATDGWGSRRVGIAAASVASRSGFQGPAVMTPRCSIPSAAAARQRRTNWSLDSSASSRVPNVFSIASYGRPTSAQ